MKKEYDPKLGMYRYNPEGLALHKFRHVSFSVLIGIGYWRDKYDPRLTGVSGVAHNLILPFTRIQWGYLIKPKK